MLYQLFKDFDDSKISCRGVLNHGFRIVFLTYNVNPERRSIYTSQLFQTFPLSLRDQKRTEYTQEPNHKSETSLGDTDMNRAKISIT